MSLAWGLPNLGQHVNVTYKATISAHRVCKKSNAMPRPTGFDPTFMKTVLASLRLMPDVGSRLISSSLQVSKLREYFLHYYIANLLLQGGGVR